MAKSFTQNPASPRQHYMQKYNTSRANLLLVVAFTAINVLLLVANADSYFLFSAFIPYFLTSMGMLLCGRFPEEFYTDEFSNMEFLDNSVFVVLLIISIAITLLYLLAWFMSRKNRSGWLVFALVLFGIDTLGMLFLNGIAIDSLMDILFHAWVIYYLIIGISASSNLKYLPAETIAESPAINVDGNEENNAEASEAPSETNSIALRDADKAVKHRILLSAHIHSFDICYRRVKHTNELVINGKVYDELVAMIEPPHTLQAHIDGHDISAGYNGAQSYITFDGKTISKKVRLY